MPDNLSHLSVIIPSHNEDHGILSSLKSELESLGAEVIIVDDGSQEPYPSAIKHGINFGYGSALMTGIKNSTRDIIICIDGDGQHTAREVVRLYSAWELMECDMLIGTRRLRNEKLLRFLGRKFLNIIASFMAMYWLPDLNSGMRIFRKSTAIGYFPILCKTFSFTTSITMSYMCDNYKVEWFPIKVEPRVYGKSRVKVIKDGIVTLYYILKIGFALRTRGVRSWLRKLRKK